MQVNTKILFSVVALILVAGGGYMFMKEDTNVKVDEDMITDMREVERVMPTAPTPPTPATIKVVKEFSMTAYYDATGKWYSLKEMSVKKGDTVRVTITNTKGMHDFVIDELGVKKVLTLNEPVVVEFVASKAGNFVYYCSMPGHREGGQWGTLRVTE